MLILVFNLPKINYNLVKPAISAYRTCHRYLYPERWPIAPPVPFLLTPQPLAKKMYFRDVETLQHIINFGKIFRPASSKTFKTEILTPTFRTLQKIFL